MRMGDWLWVRLWFSDDLVPFSDGVNGIEFAFVRWCFVDLGFYDLTLLAECIAEEIMIGMLSVIISVN